MKALFIILIILGGIVGAETAQAETYDLEKILKRIGDNYIKRADLIVNQTAIEDSNIAFIHDVTTFTNLFVPTPSNLEVLFQGEKVTSPEIIRKHLALALQRNELSPLLEKSLFQIDKSREERSLASFREASNLFFGIYLLWSVREEYSLNFIESKFSEEKLFSLAENIGRAEMVPVGRERYPGPVFSASYLLRYHIKRNVSDLFYFWAAVAPRLEEKYGEELTNLPPNLTRKLFDFLVYGIEEDNGKMKGLAQNFLTDFEKIFSSVELYFPFHPENSNVTTRTFGKLGMLRDQYKLIGNTSMLDRINKLRLMNLSKNPSLTPAWIERLCLKAWGHMTNWGTSVSRVLYIGLIIYFALFISSFGSSVEKLSSNKSQFPTKLEKNIEVLERTASKFIGYATLKNNDFFETKILDHGFSIVIFIYYTALLGTIITFLLRNN